MIKDITTVKDVETFFLQLLAEGLNFHPDEGFINYVNIDTCMPTFTVDEAELRNRLMEKCFEVCEQENVDIYDLGQELSLKWTGLDKFIPLPSSIKEL